MTHPKAPYSGHGNMDKAAQYRGNWHKITPEEIPHLEALGLAIRTARIEAGLTLRQAGELAELHHMSWMKLEAGVRRTRATTLRRIANALAPRVGFDPTLFTLYLIDTAGPALAPEMGEQNRRSVDA